MQSVDIAAGTIEYREAGAPGGAPVVLLHGLLMNDAQWDLALPLLPDECRYILPVLPLGGHRIPMGDDVDLTMPAMVQILANFLDALDLVDVTLVVTDWGGPLFLTDLGLDKRVGRMVICPSEAFDNFPPGFPGKVVRLAAINTWTVQVAMRQLKNSWLRRRWLLFGQMAKQPVPQQIVDKWLESGLADRAIRRDLIRYCRSAFDDEKLICATRRLADFDKPALVIWSRNPVMPFDHGRRLAEILPQGRLQIIDNAYVLVMLDEPAATARAISEFLRS